jgi:hypothetical protein
MGKFDDQLIELAGAQHYVVSRPQLLEFGTRTQVDYRLKRGALARLYDSVYRLPGSQPTFRQNLMAACMAGGRFSVASFRSAAQLWQLPGGDEVLEITSPRWRRVRDDEVIPHESYHLTDRDIAYVDNVPVTRPVRVINDMGLLVTDGVMDPIEYDLMIHEAVRRNLVDVAQLWREWERLGGVLRPGGIVVQHMLDRFVPPVRQTDSRAESRLLQVVRAAGFPEPVPQYRVWLSPARWVDLDFAWPDQHGYCEFDPYKWHGDRDKYMRDAKRRLELRGLGWDGVSVTDDELDAGAHLAMAALARIVPCVTQP